MLRSALLFSRVERVKGKTMVRTFSHARALEIEALVAHRKPQREPGVPRRGASPHGLEVLESQTCRAQSPGEPDTCTRLSDGAQKERRRTRAAVPSGSEHRELLYHRCARHGELCARAE